MNRSTASQKSETRDSRFYYGIFFLIIGIGLSINHIYHDYDIEIQPIFVLINLIPGYIFLFLARKKRTRTLFGRIVNDTLFILITLIVLVWNSTGAFIERNMIGITALRHYPDILAEYQYPTNKCIQHFPENIGSHQKDAKFLYRHGILMGGLLVYLTQIESNTEVQKTLDTYSRTAVRIYEQDFRPYRSDESQGIAYIPQSILHFDDNIPFLKVLVLGSTPATNGGWNHGESYGIAIKQDTGEVTYWCESW